MYKFSFRFLAPMLRRGIHFSTSESPCCDAVIPLTRSGCYHRLQCSEHILEAGTPMKIQIKVCNAITPTRKEHNINISRPCSSTVLCNSTVRCLSMVNSNFVDGVIVIHAAGGLTYAEFPLKSPQKQLSSGISPPGFKTR